MDLSHGSRGMSPENALTIVYNDADGGLTGREDYVANKRESTR